MNDRTDSQLLRAYAEDRSEPAFAELVRRHVDFVHSAARRMVCDAHLAEDVTQGVFVALAKNPGPLTDRPVLSGWLHRTAQNIAAQTVRTDVRRRAREQEAAAMNELLAPAPDAPWEDIAPHLDAALGELTEADRDALLLRYFERKSAQEMAQVLGISDEAAQKRVSRAVERLREFLARRGVTAGASGLVVLISANGVLTAPAGLSAAIAATALAGTTIFTATTATVGKAIAMTTMQKVLIAAALAAAVGTGIYEARDASKLRAQVQTLQQQIPSAGQNQRLIEDRDDALRQLSALRADNERLARDTSDLLRLRAEVTRLRQENQMAKPERATTPAAVPLPMPVNPGDYFLKDQLAFAGFASPEATMQSSTWAMANANYEAFTNTLSPKAFEEQQKKPDSRKTMETAFSILSPRFLAMQILARKDISDQQVEIKVRWDLREPASATGPVPSLVTQSTQFWIQPLVKVGNEWKREGSSHPYIPDWDKSGTIQSFVP